MTALGFSLGRCSRQTQGGVVSKGVRNSVTPVKMEGKQKASFSVPIQRQRIQREGHFSTTPCSSILFSDSLLKVTFKPTSPMGHAIYINQKSFSTLLHCFFCMNGILYVSEYIEVI